jgi:hypothetical protein
MAGTARGMRRLALLAALAAVVGYGLDRRRREDPAARLDRAARSFELRRGAIRRRAAWRPDFFEFEVRGRIRAGDLGAMARLLEAAFARWDEIDVLIAMPDWQGIDAGAALHPRALRAQARSNAHIRRYAVVGPPDWAGRMIEAFDPLTPVDARVFAPGAEAEARAWVLGG